MIAALEGGGMVVVRNFRRTTGKLTIVRRVRRFNCTEVKANELKTRTSYSTKLKRNPNICITYGTSACFKQNVPIDRLPV